MSAMPETDDDSHFSFLEMDAPSGLRAAPPEPILPDELDLSDEQIEFGAPAPTLQQDLNAIAAGGAANAAVTGIGSQRGGEMRGVGFSTRDGYVAAIRNGVPGHTYQQYLTTLRTSYGMTSAEARVDQARRHIRDAIASLEAVFGDDYSGISARFSAVWDEIEFDRLRNGGVL